MPFLYLCVFIEAEWRERAKLNTQVAISKVFRLCGYVLLCASFSAAGSRQHRVREGFRSDTTVWLT